MGKRVSILLGEGLIQKVFRSRWSVLALCAALGACSPDPEPEPDVPSVPSPDVPKETGRDGGASSWVPLLDGSVPMGMDAGGALAADAGSIQDAFDAGVPSVTLDAGSGTTFDAGSGTTVDAGVSSTDAGASNGCPNELLVTPEVNYLPPWGNVTFDVTNGTGPFTFRIADDTSPDGVVSDVLGRYTAGDVAGGKDTVIIEDTTCGLMAEVVIHVVPPLEAEPDRLWVPPGTHVQINPVGGSGFYSYELIFSGVGGTINSFTGVYQAPAVQDDTNPPYGLDTILVQDQYAGFSLTIDVFVDSEASLQAAPPNLIIPMNSYVDLQPRGGTGFYDVTVTPAAGLGYIEGQFYGETAGDYEVTVVDQQTGLSTFMNITVSSGQRAGVGLLGDPQFDARMISAGDVNDDGFEDVLLGRWDADYNFRDEGVVFLYLGSADGFIATPAQAFSGGTRMFNMGRQLDLGDVTGDGRPDLILGVGRYRPNDAASEPGGVRIHRGVPGGFEPDPMQTVYADKNADNMGFSVTVCDFNGDGHDDIAAGAINAEDDDADDTAGAQGAIFLYAGNGSGVSQEPVQIIHGQRLSPASGGQGSSWVDASNLKMGRFLASGHIDADGRCELVSANYLAKTDSGRGEDGMIKVFKGQESTADGLVSPQPSWAAAAYDAQNKSNEFARVVRVADVNQDGLMDILASHHRADTDGASGSNHGALRVFFSPTLSETPVENYVAPYDADLSRFSTVNYGYYGFDSAVADVNGDAVPDLLVGALRNQVGDWIGTGSQRRGSIEVFLGPLTPERFGEEPDWVVRGTGDDDYFSSQFQVVNIGNVYSGPPGVIAYASLHNTEAGDDMGLLQFIPFDPEILHKEVSYGEGDDAWDAGVVVSDTLSDFDAGADGGTQADDDSGVAPAFVLQCALEIDRASQYLFAGDVGTASLTVLNAATTISGEAPQDGGVGVEGVVAQAMLGVFKQQDGNDVDIVYQDLVTSDPEQDLFELSFSMTIAGHYGLVAKVQLPTGEWHDCVFGDAPSSPTAAVLLVRQRMETPVTAGTVEFGADVAFVPDFFGTDQPALAVGAPGNGRAGGQLWSGEVFLYQHQDGVWDTNESVSVYGFKHHRSYDHLGRNVAPAGDFDGDGFGDLLASLEYADIYDHNEETGLIYDDGCPSLSGKDHGVVYVFGGGAVTDWRDPSHDIREPLFGIYGLQNKERIRALAGNFDYNGDGYSDFLFSGHWDSGNEAGNNCGGSNCGGYALVAGRPFDLAPGQTKMLCAPELVQFGHNGSDHMGRSLAAVGDVDGDGCDEFAVGSSHENNPLRDQGLIRIIFGWGPNCSESEAKQVVIGPGVAYRYIGYDLDGQHDVDGDGVVDLAIGAPYYRVPASNEQTGAGILVSGRWLASLKDSAQPVATDEPPATVYPLGQAGYGEPQFVFGQETGAWAGHAVSLVPNGSGFGRAALAVGWPRGNFLNRYRTGGSVIHRSGADGLLQPYPKWVLSGETFNENGELGMVMDSILLNGKSFLVSCGRYGLAMGIGQGACYVLEIK